MPFPDAADISGVPHRFGQIGFSQTTILRKSLAGSRSGGQLQHVGSGEFGIFFPRRSKIAALSGFDHRADRVSLRIELISQPSPEIGVILHRFGKRGDWAQPAPVEGVKNQNIANLAGRWQSLASAMYADGGKADMPRLQPTRIGLMRSAREKDKLRTG